jgi:hypothetical protein
MLEIGIIRYQNQMKRISKKKKKKTVAGHWWFMFVILATQEAKIRKTAVRSQPRQIVCETLSQRNSSEKRDGEWLRE